MSTKRKQPDLKSDTSLNLDPEENTERRLNKICARRKVETYIQLPDGTIRPASPTSLSASAEQQRELTRYYESLTNQD